MQATQTARALIAGALIAGGLMTGQTAHAATPATHHVRVEFNHSSDLSYWHPYKGTSNVTVHNNVLDFNLPAGKRTGVSMGGWLIANNAVSGDVSIKLKVVGANGYGMANMVWPTGDAEFPGGDWRKKEIDFPETGNFGNQSMAAHDHATGDRCGKPPVLNCPTDWSWYTPKSFKVSDWHTYRTVWNGAGTSYWLDGHKIKSVHTWAAYGKHRVDTIQFRLNAAKSVAGHAYLANIDARWTEGQ